MEPIISGTTNRSSSYEKVVLVIFSFLAVISPLYINRGLVINPEVEDQPFNFAPWLLFFLILAIALLLYIDRGFTRTGRFSSRERLMGMGMLVLAVVSPLYINRELGNTIELKQESVSQASIWLPLLLLVLVLAIVLSLYLDQSLTRFDPDWIYRVGGSSGGIVIVLVILAVVLKCKV